jgi:ubiquinone/menaquinone biosynthesis C-methylase UbiE
MSNSLLQKRYDTIASLWNSEAYAGLRMDDLISDMINIMQLEKINRQTPEILDVMCGTGIVGIEVYKYLKSKSMNPEVSFLDFSQAMLDEIPEEFAKIKIQSDVTMLPFTHSFDRIVMRFGLYDLEYTSQLPALREVYRQLRSDGLFILTSYCPMKKLQPYYNGIVNFKDQLAGWSDGQNERYFATEKELRTKLACAGFKNVKRKLKFFGTLRYEKTGEMNKLASEKWKRYVLDIPKLIRKKMRIKLQLDGTVEYQFPGIILVAEK